MKNFLLAAFIATTLAACGTQEKTEDPFGRIDNPQKDGSMTEATFKRNCAMRKGQLDVSETTCVVTTYKKEFTNEDLRKELDDAGFKTFDLGQVPAGSNLFGDVKGGQTVVFFLGNQPFTSMSEGRLAPVRVPLAGRLKMTVNRGTYEYLNVYVTECFSRTTANAECPR